MRTRVNKTNRPAIMEHIAEALDRASQSSSGGGIGKISIIDIWDIEIEVEEKYNLSDPASQKIVLETLTTGQPD